MSKIFADTFEELQKVCATFSRSIKNQRQVIRDKNKDKDKRRYRRQETDKEFVIPVENDYDIDQYLISNNEEKEGNSAKKDTTQPKTKNIRKRRKLKPKRTTEGKPKPPVNQFMLFLRDNQDAIREQNPNLRSSQIPKIASDKWRKAPSFIREKYKKLYEDKWMKYVQDITNHDNDRIVTESLSGGIVNVEESDEKERQNDDDNYEDDEEDDHIDL